MLKSGGYFLISQYLIYLSRECPNTFKPHRLMVHIEMKKTLLLTICLCFIRNPNVHPILGLRHPIQPSHTAWKLSFHSSRQGLQPFVAKGEKFHTAAVSPSSIAALQSAEGKTIISTKAMKKVVSLLVFYTFADVAALSTSSNTEYL